MQKSRFHLLPQTVKNSPYEGILEGVEGIRARVQKTHSIIEAIMTLKFQLEYYLQYYSMSPSALARRARVPRQNISNWLMNQKPRNIDQVKRVADVFGVTLDHLLFGKPEKDSERVPLENIILADEKWVSGRFEIKIRKIK